ncbi:MAG: RecQ family ATP-dependent DNA helicase [Bacteroidetes bacterium]|nr:RecQ family ATP-dependent DNA helicase [Bacteroidota bacterium]
MHKSPQEILNEIFHHDEFRPFQEEIIYSVLSGKHTLGVLPTGAGKSICYQLPGVMLPGITIVVSPLIALMNDQIKRLQRLDIKVAGIYGNMNQEQIDIALDNCKYGEVKFLFLSPERLSSLLVKTRIKQMEVSLYVIDEAHCVSQWGHDFRPSYLNIKILREWHPNTPCLALTATCTPKVKKDILEILEITKAKVFQGSYLRPQLSYYIKKSENKIADLINIIKRRPAPGIIYVNKRKLTDLLSKELEKNSLPHEIYHAGIPVKEKEKAAKNWLLSDSKWMIATSAFGMGIDKPNVRSIVHFHVPGSMEEYYQESGRAGRDGEKATSIILYSQEDTTFLKLNIEWAFPERTLIKKVYDSLFNYKKIAVGGGAEIGFSFDLADFCSKFGLPAKNTFYAIEILEKCGYLFQTEDVQKSSKIQVLGSKQILNELTAHDTLEGKVLGTLLRSYSGLHLELVDFSESIIAERCDITRHEVINTLQRLEQKEIVHYELMSFLPKIIFTQNRIDSQYLIIPKELLEERRKVKTEQANYMIAFVENKNQCRSQLICKYFSEDAPRCHQCDNCANPNNNKDIKQYILEELTSKKSAEKLIENAPFLKDEVLAALRELLELNKVKVDKEGFYSS